MLKDNDEYEKIKEISLKHRGEKNPISAKEISQKLGFPMEDTQSECRKKIHKTVEEFDLPLLSNSKGFFLATNQNEVDKYNENIEMRIKGMKQYNDLVNKNWNKIQNRKEKK